MPTHTHTQTVTLDTSVVSKHHLVLTNTNDIRVNLHVEQGRDIRSQVVPGDTFRDILIPGVYGVSVTPLSHPLHKLPLHLGCVLLRAHGSAVLNLVGFRHVMY